MPNPREKLALREKEMQDLLAAIKKIDASLSVLTPSDPKRPELIAKKAELLPRYRGAKQHVKQLRRVVNELPKGTSVVTNDDGVDWVDENDPSSLLKALYEVLAEGIDKAHDQQPQGHPLYSIHLNEDQREVITDFLDWWEHDHSEEEEEQRVGAGGA